jgi:hypothetical protein
LREERREKREERKVEERREKREERKQEKRKEKRENFYLLPITLEPSQLLN